MKIRLLLILITKKENQNHAVNFLRNVKPENYSNNGFQVNAQHLHDTTPSRIEIKLHFEIKYRYGKERNSNKSTNNNIVYYIELFVDNVKNYGKLLIHQTKIVAPENEFANLPNCIHQMKEESEEEDNFLNYL